MGAIQTSSVVLPELTPRQIYMREYRKSHKAEKAQYSKIWNEKNRDYLLAYQREYYKEHPEKYKIWLEKHPEYPREYYKKNKESENQKMKLWQENHPDYCLEYSREYVKLNPEKIREYIAKRGAAPGEITPGWVVQLLTYQNWTCIVCLKDLRLGYHLDHITPIARGGHNTDYNLQALCPKCNWRKSSRDPIEFMQAEGFLL